MEYYVFAILCDNESFTLQRSEVHTSFVLGAMILKWLSLWLMMMNSTLLNTLCNLNDHPKWIHLFFILFHSGLARINQLKPIVLLPQFQQLICLLTQGGKTQLRLGKDNWIKYFYKIRNTISWIMQLPALFQFLDGFY